VPRNCRLIVAVEPNTVALHTIRFALVIKTGIRIDQEPAVLFLNRAHQNNNGHLKTDYSRLRGIEPCKGWRTRQECRMLGATRTQLVRVGGMIDLKPVDPNEIRT
jgi:hypothetical protein